MRKPSLRRILASGILVLWAAVLGMHVRREYFRPLSSRIELGARSLAPGSAFYGVQLNGVAIGLATSRLDTVATGFVLEDLLMLDIPAMDTVHRVEAQTRLELTRALEVQTLSFALGSALGRYVVRGRAESDTLRLEVDAGGDREAVALPLAEGVLPAAVVPLRLAAAGRLRVGEASRLRVFDPSTLSDREVEIRVVAHDTLVYPDSVAFDEGLGRWVPAAYDTVPVWRIEESYGGVRVSSWVDEDGRLVRAESPLGYVLERKEYELAAQEWRKGRADARLAAGYGAIIESTAIASDVPLEAGDGPDQLRVRLVGVELAGFDLAGGRQTLRGDTLTVVRERPEALAPGYRLPYRGGGEAAGELGSTPLIQAADPRIVRAAREIAGDETDPVEVARRLNAWVYRTVEKRITPSVPSAVQVLEGRSGDCNEHTVLYVALARALGLPARTAVGLVHVGGRYYYHAWPEVWLGEWVAVDPTLGQFPADATHLRFLVGGLARQVELVRLIGRLQIETL